MNSFTLKGNQIFNFRGQKENGCTDGKMRGAEVSPCLNHLNLYFFAQVSQANDTVRVRTSDHIQLNLLLHHILKAPCIFSEDYLRSYLE